jgi:flavin reductase (DIM6/NTAB) family NADH-FMN oxidoreductase RutF
MSLAKMEVMHINVEPSILYLGTPVVLVSTLNEDETVNVAPMSSAWWLGWNCMLGLGNNSQTACNLLREKECVLNLPSVDSVGAVNRLAKLTGNATLSPWKQSVGYRFERDKLRVSGLSASPSELVGAFCLTECPIQLEAVLESTRPFGNGPDTTPGAYAFEVRVVRAHVEESLLVSGCANHIDPDRWRPLIMSFSRFYGLGTEISSSTLAEISEEAYRPQEHMAR